MTTATRPTTVMVDLICREPGCGLIKSFPVGTTYNGKLIKEWFVSDRGSRCVTHYQPPPLVKPTVGRNSSIQERFEAFHAANPTVYTALVELARDLVARGRQKLAIGMLWEVLRWQYFVATDDPTSDYKLNDHYRSRYARLIDQHEPDLCGYFELRELRA